MWATLLSADYFRKKILNNTFVTTLKLSTNNSRLKHQFGLIHLYQNPKFCYAGQVIQKNLH